MTTAPPRPGPVGDCPPASADTLTATPGGAPAAQDSRPVLASLAVVATMVMWASAFVAIRHIGPVLSPGPLALIRVVIATLVLLPLALRAGLAIPRGRDWWVVVPYAVLWMGLYSVVINAAEHHLDAGTTAMLVNVAPIVVTLWVGLVQRAGFARPLVLGLAVAFTGVSVIALGGDGAQRNLIGIALGLLAAVLYATGILLQKRLLRSMDALSVTWWGMALGALALLPFAPAALTEAGSAPASALLGALYLGIFPTALAFTLWAYALRRVDAARLSLSSYLVPAFTVLLSWALLAEVPSVAALVGGSLCLAGVAISRIGTRR